MIRDSVLNEVVVMKDVEAFRVVVDPIVCWLVTVLEYVEPGMVIVLT